MSDYNQKLQAELQRFKDFTDIQKKNCISLYEQYQTYLRENKKIDWAKVSAIAADGFTKYEQLAEPSDAELKACMGKTAVLKLNGGLGTSMGCAGPKSLLVVRDGQTFIDFSIQQLMTINKKCGVDVPLVLMNSFSTEADTKRHLGSKNYQLKIHHFNQFELPRMDAESKLPAQLEGAAQFYPPGHGFVYECLESSGTLDALIKQGIEWIFISNSDNLGAVLDPKICHFVTTSNNEFVSELTPKLEADVKGGVLINYEGSIHLLESAQVPEEHVKDFCDVKQFPYFHINNLWVKLSALKKAEKALDLIVNPKNVQGKAVIQLECAAGAMIANMKAAPLVVPRTRFRPVKKSGDLLLLQSDCFTVDGDFILQQTCANLPTVIVDQPVDKFVKMFANVPSLKSAKRFIVEGEVECQNGVTITGEYKVSKGESAVLETGKTYGQ